MANTIEMIGVRPLQETSPSGSGLSTKFSILFSSVSLLLRQSSPPFCYHRMLCFFHQHILHLFLVQSPPLCCISDVFVCCSAFPFGSLWTACCPGISPITQLTPTKKSSNKMNTTKKSIVHSFVTVVQLRTKGL